MIIGNNDGYMLVVAESVSCTFGAKIQKGEKVKKGCRLQRNHINKKRLEARKYRVLTLEVCINSGVEEML